MSDTGTADIQVLFTANLRADFDLLPHVFNTIQQRRQQQAENITGTLLLDLGGAWSPDSPASRLTENRAPYVVLDSMAYHAAWADGLDVNGILGLQSAVQVRLLLKQLVYRWNRRDVSINIGAEAKPPAIRLQPTPSPGEDTFFKEEPGLIHLFQPPNDTLGEIDFRWPDMQVTRSTAIPFDRSRPPNPTIIAAIEFVEREARRYAGKNK
jgi:hypothetical protein